MFTVLTVVFTGCKKDDKNDGSIEGRWKAKSGVEKVKEGDGEWITKNCNFEAGEFEIEFSKGKFKEYYRGDLESEGSYSLNGDRLTFDYGGGDKETVTVKTLNANTLVISWEDKGLEGDVWVTEITEITYTR